MAGEKTILFLQSTGGDRELFLLHLGFGAMVGRKRGSCFLDSRDERFTLLVRFVVRGCFLLLVGGVSGSR